MSKQQHKKVAGLVPVILFTPDELTLFLDAHDLLHMIASVKVEMGPDVSSIEPFAQATRQKIATAKGQVRGMSILDSNDYVILNAAVLVFLQVVRLMPEMLSEQYALERLLTEKRLLALQRKIRPYVVHERPGKRKTHD